MEHQNFLSLLQITPHLLLQLVLLIVITSFLISSAFCQAKIGIDSVIQHVGEKVTVCAKVYGTKAMEKVTFLNLGAAYPDSKLTIVIFAKDVSNFKEVPDQMYQDKNVCVTGVIKEYQGKPEIIASSPDEIKIQ